jgi:ABC-type branched-subunit amino acid transport system ATPase component/ABC-type branched-subunit amino acid transport system permease subunit
MGEVRVTRVLRHPLVPLVAALLILPHVLPLTRATVSLATEIAIFVLLGLGFNLLLGYTGLVSFGHGAYFGVAAYAGSLAQIHLVTGVGVPILVGVAAGALLGAVIGFLVMRKRGVYFSLLTLAFTQMIFSIVYRWTDVTGGENGLGGVERPAIRLPLVGTLDLGDAMTYYHFVLVFVVAGALLMWRVVRSPFGTTLVAIRENEQRASFIGYPTRAYKLAAFVVSATLTGLAGILYALLIRFVYPETVHVNFSGEILAMTVVGGMRHFLGPALGGAFFVFFRDFLSAYTENWLVLFGGLFMLFILVSPEGLLGIGEQIARGLGVGSADRAPPTPPRSEAVRGTPAAPRSPAPPGPDMVPHTPPRSEAARVGERLGTEAVASHAPDPAVLVAENVVKRFGALAAVDGVSLTVRRGELLSVIGPNGAGKTTLFNALTGLFPPDGGRVRLRGTDVTGRAPHLLVRQGLARSFQIVSVFQELSAFENVRLAVQARSPVRRSLLVRADRLGDVNAATWHVLDAIGLADLAATRAASLSHGDQRLLEIAIVLATEPEVLLLDEPLAGLAPADRTRVADTIRALAGSITVILIEHDIDRVLAISDRIVVLHQGRLIAEGTPEEIQENPEVQAAYMGSTTARVTPAPPVADARPLLTVRGLNAAYAKSHVLHDVSLEVREGEVIALLGRNGVGKTTTLHSIMGDVPWRRGSVSFRGEELVHRAPEEVARRGVGLVPQGRRIFPNLTVLENLLIAARPGRTGEWSVDRVFGVFPKLAMLATRRGEQLSGGERQMLAIGRALMANPILLLLDEPFEGLAPSVVEGVVGALAELRGRTTMLLVEQNADLALGLADRAYVLNNGTVSWTGPALALRDDMELRGRLLGV